MKALTICQPFAHLICLPETDPRHKRVENRTWPSRYRGPLLIHAGKSQSWLSLDDDKLSDWAYKIRVTDMRFGAIVAQCQLIDCVQKVIADLGEYDLTYPWLRTHQHVEGPWCWVLADVTPLPEPIPYRGAQGLWDMPDLEYIAATERWPREAAHG